MKLDGLPTVVRYLRSGNEVEQFIGVFIPGSICLVGANSHWALPHCKGPMNRTTAGYL